MWHTGVDTVVQTLPNFAEVSGSQLFAEFNFTAWDFPVVTGFPGEIIHLWSEAWTWRRQFTT